MEGERRIRYEVESGSVEYMKAEPTRVEGCQESIVGVRMPRLGSRSTLKEVLAERKR